MPTTQVWLEPCERTDAHSIDECVNYSHEIYGMPRAEWEAYGHKADVACDDCGWTQGHDPEVEH